MALMKVKANKGRRVQVEGRPGVYLSETTPTEVDGDKHYYQIALRDEDIVEWSKEDEAAATAAAKKLADEQAAAAKEAEKQSTQQAAAK